MIRCLPVALVGCGVHLPPAPGGLERPLPVDRAAMPALTIHAAETCRVQMPDRQARAGGDRKVSSSSPVSAYVVQHPTQGVLVIDTGFGRRTAEDPREYPGRLPMKLLDAEMGTPLVDQLPALGLTAADIDHVVVTHLHHDHAGGLEDLPDATLHVDADEWRWARKKRLIHGTDPLPYAGRTVTPVDWVHHPYGPFPAHADLFGDGSVVLLRSAGHTPGSLMVLVNTAEHSWLFTGDAAWVDANWREPIPKGGLPRSLVEVDWREGMDTLWRLNALSTRADLTIVSGHEPTNVQRMRPWPEPLVPWENVR